MWFYYLIGIIVLYFLIEYGFAGWCLYRAHINPAFKTPQNKFTGTGKTFEESHETEIYTVLHTVEDGIERIIYTPKRRKHETPIFMAHGMWHGAWCWEAWQKLFAEWGWESIAYSLPGHGKSTLQRPIWLCTLDYYLAFVRDEVSRLPRKPILMGHSMGGALSQWYLRHIGDDLPAVVLVAPWTSHHVMLDSMPLFLKLDPIGSLLTSLKWNAGPLMRSPKTAAAALITAGATLSPEELHARLNSESALVTLQHNPPFWHPAENPKTPILLLAGEKDAVVPFEGLRHSAAYYKADFISVPEAGHNLMMEKSYKETAQKINDWLTKLITEN
jgi:pimeloyl-ACP methyl ester carboxylesterase